jgi:predicted secreted Zn-dependent protease
MTAIRALLHTPRDRLGLALAFLVVGLAACSPLSGSASQTGPTPTHVSQQTADVELISTLSVTYYSVFGNNTEELVAYMNENGPMTADGERAVGLATAKPKRDWRARMEGQDCMVGSMTITVEVSLMLPRLDSSARLNPATLRNWQTFAAGVEAHEQRHVDIYLQGFEEMRAGMASIGPKDTCAAIEAEVRRVWESYLAIINVRQEDYHAEDDRRVEREREPIRRQIEANRLRMQAIASQITDLDRSLETMKAQWDDLEGRLAALKMQIDAIAERYPDLVLPEPTYSHYQQLKAEYNSIVPSYNTLLAQFEAASRLRQSAISEHNRLAANTSQLVEDFNWIQ